MLPRTSAFDPRQSIADGVDGTVIAHPEMQTGMVSGATPIAPVKRIAPNETSAPADIPSCIASTISDIYRAAFTQNGKKLRV
jgi:hypothetical protein